LLLHDKYQLVDLVRPEGANGNRLKNGLKSASLTKPERLRHFRDRVLNRTAEGRELIKLYYQLSPAITAAMEEDEAFKAEVKEAADGMLPLIQKMVE